MNTVAVATDAKPDSLRARLDRLARQEAGSANAEVPNCTWAQRLRWLERPGSAERIARRLLGPDRLRRHAAALRAARPAIREALLAAAALPPLGAPQRSALPAGTTLHREAIDPARAVATWEGLPQGYPKGRRRDAVLAYRGTLQSSGYASGQALRDGLPGALLLGLLRDLPDGADVSALLDLIDTLSLRTRDATLAMARAYADADASRRARRLLSAHLERTTQDDPPAVTLLARLRIDRDRGRRPRRDTLDSAAVAATLAPDDPALALALARVQSERGDLDRARRTLESLAARHPMASGLESARRRTALLGSWHADAARSDVMPRVELDEQERRGQRFHADTLAAALALYRRHGTLALDGVFPSELLESCRAQFLARNVARHVARHGDAFSSEARDRSLPIGDRRLQVSLELDGAFNTPEFYANPFVLQLVRGLLDSQAIIGSMVCATSFPGAKAQHLHKDHRALFTRDADDEPIDLPPVAITLMIPLVPLDEEVGTTEVLKGSHRLSAPASASLARQRPILPLGGCFLMDLSLSHAGQGNRSDRVRPIVNMQYTRRWFVDNKNFKRQRPLSIGTDAWRRVPREHRPLFDWARTPRPSVDR